jgi:hypothetical protein
MDECSGTFQSRIGLLKSAIHRASGSNSSLVFDFAVARLCVSSRRFDPKPGASRTDRQAGQLIEVGG